MRCYVEPSPAGGYFVRLRGEAAPLSRHDTEEEAEAAAAAYERGLAREDPGEHVTLPDGREVVIRPVRRGEEHADVDGFDREAIVALAGRERAGVARYARSAERPHIAEATVTVGEGWEDLEERLLRRLVARARENGIHVLAVPGGGEVPL